MALKLSVTAAVLFGLGPLGATLGLLPAMAGFGMFALGGVVGILALVWGALAALRGREGWPAAGLGFVVTAVFLVLAVPGGSYPRYNDFTTDTEDPPGFVRAGDLPANQGRDMRYPGGEVTAAQHRAYPDLHPLDLGIPPAAAFAEVRAVAQAMPGWEITVEDAAAGVIEGVATTRVFRFRDDFVIRVRAHGQGSRVDMRSKSRDGRGDIGANAKRIRAFLDAVAAAQ